MIPWGYDAMIDIIYQRVMEDYIDVCSPECRISVGKGWESLLRSALEAFRLGNTGAKLLKAEEKYGMLVMRLENSMPEDLHIVLRYAELSSKVCELCGEPGSLRPSGEVKTHCDACHLSTKTVDLPNFSTEK